MADHGRRQAGRALQSGLPQQQLTGESSRLKRDRPFPQSAVRQRNDIKTNLRRLLLCMPEEARRAFVPVGSHEIEKLGKCTAGRNPVFWRDTAVEISTPFHRRQLTMRLPASRANSSSCVMTTTALPRMQVCSTSMQPRIHTSEPRSWARQHDRLGIRINMLQQV